MDWGMKNRLSQLIPNGRCFFLPIDHGYFQGPTSCLEKPGETIKPLLEFCDALFVTEGFYASSRPREFQAYNTTCFRRNEYGR